MTLPEFPGEWEPWAKATLDGNIAQQKWCPSAAYNFL